MNSWNILAPDDRGKRALGSCRKEINESIYYSGSGHPHGWASCRLGRRARQQHQTDCYEVVSEWSVRLGAELGLRLHRRASRLRRMNSVDPKPETEAMSRQGYSVFSL